MFTLASIQRCAGNLFAGRFASIVAIGCCLLAAMPLALSAIYVGRHLSDHPQRVRLGDQALTELFTWHAAHGTQLEGCRSHYGFQFPGPLQFYGLAPVYALTGCKADSLILASLAINLAAVATLLFVVRRCDGNVPAISWAVALATYQAFLGPLVISSAWGPWLAHLPFLATIVLIAAVAAGRPGYLPAALLSCSFLIQTHPAYTLCLAAALVAALLLWMAPGGFRAGCDVPCPGLHRRWWILALSLAIVVPAWLPTLLSASHAGTSNVAALLDYFNAPAQYSWRQAAQVWMQALSAFPRFIAMGQRSPVGWPDRTSTDPLFDAAMLGIQAIMLATSYGLARRNRQGLHCALSLLIAVMLPSSLVSVRCIRQPGDFAFLVYWISSVSFLLAGTFLATVSWWFLDRLPPRAGPWLRAVLGCAVAAGLAYGCLQILRRDLTDLVPDLERETNAHRRARLLGDAACEALHRQGANRCTLCIADPDLWPLAAGLVVRLTKAGFSPAVERPWWPLFGHDHARADSGESKLFLGRADWAARARVRAGVESIAESKADNAALLWRSAQIEAVGNYSLDELSLFASDYEGFALCEHDGSDTVCWSDGLTSRVTVPLVGGHAYRMTVRATPMPLSGRVQSMTVELNGEALVEVRFDRSEPLETTFELPAARVREQNEIVFRYGYTFCHREHSMNADGRRLGVCFSRFELQQVETPSFGRQ